MRKKMTNALAGVDVEVHGASAARDPFHFASHSTAVPPGAPDSDVVMSDAFGDHASPPADTEMGESEYVDSIALPEGDAASSSFEEQDVEIDASGYGSSENDGSAYGSSEAEGSVYGSRESGSFAYGSADSRRDDGEESEFEGSGEHRSSAVSSSEGRTAYGLSGDDNPVDESGDERGERLWDFGLGVDQRGDFTAGHPLSPDARAAAAPPFEAQSLSAPQLEALQPETGSSPNARVHDWVNNGGQAPESLEDILKRLNL